MRYEWSFAVRSLDEMKEAISKEFITTPRFITLSHDIIRININSK